MPSCYKWIERFNKVTGEMDGTYGQEEKLNKNNNCPHYEFDPGFHWPWQKITTEMPAIKYCKDCKWFLNYSDAH